MPPVRLPGNAAQRPEGTMSLYQPPHFAVGDRAALLALMRERPLATLVSVTDGQPHFTHLPLEVEESAAGLRLLGHVARANPHWSLWVDGAAVTAIFHGPDGYVSPRWYAAREAVPTWNYIVVHAAGRLAVTHDAQDKERILKVLIDRHDPAYRRQWDELPESYREGMKRAIVGVTIEVERLEGKFKLSQNRPPGDRAAVRAGHAAVEPRASLADWMGRLGIGD
jgi:transcriptional regulator